MERIGLIAGNRRFPLLFAKIAKEKGDVQIVAVAIKGDTSRLINKLVDKVFWLGVGELKKMIDFFKSENIDKVVMAGQVNPDNLFDRRVALDGEFKDLFQKIQNRKADTIFKAVSDKLKEYNINLIDPTPYLKVLMPERGVLTKRAPTQIELEDIEFGKNIAKAIGHLDIGQTVVVKEKAILAIEAMEGTDRTILRGGRIGRGDAVVVKMSKPNQDMRFDVPVIGVNTVKFLIKAKASCLTIEASKTLILDREPCVSLANKNNICIVAV